MKCNAIQSITVINNFSDKIKRMRISDPFRVKSQLRFHFVKIVREFFFGLGDNRRSESANDTFPTDSQQM